MLADHLTSGTKILGLSKIINLNGPGSEGCYRVVKIGGLTAVEFLQRAAGPGEQQVRFLPYRPNKIAELPAAGAEVISGEFTGCVMAAFKRGGVLYAGHVDTNKDTSQRKEWDAIKSSPGVKIVSEVDTTGMIQEEHGLHARVLCILSAAGTRIDHVFVNKSTHAYGFKQPKGAAMSTYTSETMYTVSAVQGG